jgi:hypothetical protein
MDAFLRSGALGRTLELPGGLRLTRDRSGVHLGPIRETDRAVSAPHMLSSVATVGFPPRGVH